MTTNVVNQVPYLRTTRNFPEEIQPLVVELNRSYVDIAAKINDRVIGIFPTMRPAITGESWFITGSQKQQTLRQVFTFTSTASITHGIGTFYAISPSSKGTFTDGTNYYGLIYASNVAIAAQITFYVTATQIIFMSGVGAPTLTNGIIDLEWLSIA